MAAHRDWKKITYTQCNKDTLQNEENHLHHAWDLILSNSLDDGFSHDPWWVLPIIWYVDQCFVQWVIRVKARICLHSRGSVFKSMNHFGYNYDLFIHCSVDVLNWLELVANSNHCQNWYCSHSQWVCVWISVSYESPLSFSVHQCLNKIYLSLLMFISVWFSESFESSGLPQVSDLLSESFCFQ